MLTVGSSSIGNGDILMTGARIALPLVLNNRHIIKEKIQQAVKRFKIGESAVDASLYFTMYADFKSDYPLELVNQYLCKILRDKRLKGNQQHVKFNKTTFSIYYDFTYTEFFYASNESLDYDFTEDEDEILIPSIASTSIYLIPQKNESKKEAMDGYNLTEYLKKEILNQYNVKQMQSFAYMTSNDSKDLNPLFALLEKRMESDDITLKNISFKKNEIKLKLDALIAKNIEEIL